MRLLVIGLAVGLIACTPASSASTVTYGCTSTVGEVRSVEFSPLTDLPVSEHPEGGSIVIVPVAPTTADPDEWTVIYNVVCEALDRVMDCLTESTASATGPEEILPFMIQDRMLRCLSDGTALCPGLTAETTCFRPEVQSLELNEGLSAVKAFDAV